MNKPAFKMTIQEMLDFNDECDSAARKCPQYQGTWTIEDRAICRGEITPKALVKHWRRCETLWRSGYSACLSLDAECVFKRFKKYKALLAAYKIMGKQTACDAALGEGEEKCQS